MSEPEILHHFGTYRVISRFNGDVPNLQGVKDGLWRNMWGTSQIAVEIVRLVMEVRRLEAELARGKVDEPAEPERARRER